MNRYDNIIEAIKAHMDGLKSSGQSTYEWYTISSKLQQGKILTKNEWKMVDSLIPQRTVKVGIIHVGDGTPESHKINDILEFIGHNAEVFKPRFHDITLIPGRVTRDYYLISNVDIGEVPFLIQDLARVIYDASDIISDMEPDAIDGVVQIGDGVIGRVDMEEYYANNIYKFMLQECPGLWIEVMWV